MRRYGGILLAVAATVAAAMVWRQASSQNPPSSDRPNVVLITIDTLRADRVGVGLTPAIDALLAQGVVFSQARATAPLTLPSHASIMTGALPPDHGVRENGVDRFGGGRPTLASLLKAAGYRTAAFVSAYVLDRRFGLNDGFDVYNDSVARDASRVERLEAERPGADTVTAALEWMNAARPDTTGHSPFLLWVHLYDPHAPYTPPPSFLAARPGDPYGAEVAYADAQVERLLRALEPTILTGRTIVALTGDHGESLGDHGEATHGMLLYDAAIRVPLGIVAHGRLAGGRRHDPASLADLAPTLLTLAGHSVPRDMTGVNLLAAERPSEAYAETNYPRAAGWSPLRTLIDDRWKLIRSSETELYDLVADPKEQHNVAHAHPGVVQAMLAHLTTLGAATSAASAVPVSAEATERLRALGYVAMAPAANAGGAQGPNPRDHVAAWSTFEGALSQLVAGRAKEALPDLARLRDRYPDAPVFVSTYARALGESGHWTGALEAYRGAVKRWPTDATLLHDLSTAAREAGAIDEALAAERAAIALDGNNAAAVNGLGLLYAGRSQWNEALSAFTKATTLDPTNASSWTNLGNVRRERGDLAGARTAYEQAWTLDPRSPDAANGLGVLLVQSGRATEAVAWFERALAADRNFWEGRLNLGIAYEQSGQIDRAVAVFREVLLAPAPYARERQAAKVMLRRLAGR